MRRGPRPTADARVLPEDASARQVYEQLRRDFTRPTVPFYAVADGRFFSWYPADGPRDVKPDIAEDRFQAVVFDAARAVGLEVFGGDVAFPQPDEPVLIDLNDWPSFAPVRVAAAAAISAYIDEKAATRKTA